MERQAAGVARRTEGAAQRRTEGAAGTRERQGRSERRRCYASSAVAAVAVSVQSTTTGGVEGGLSVQSTTNGGVVATATALRDARDGHGGVRLACPEVPLFYGWAMRDLSLCSVSCPLDCANPYPWLEVVIMAEKSGPQKGILMGLWVPSVRVGFVAAEPECDSPFRHVPLGHDGDQGCHGPMDQHSAAP